MYKQTGQSWPTSIPASWAVSRLRFHTVVSPTKAEAVHLTPSTAVSFVPMEAVGVMGGLRLDQARRLDEVTNGYTYFRDGDILIAKITPCFENGKGAIASGLENGVGFGTTELHVVRPRESMDVRYLFYLSQSHSFRATGASYMYGAGGQKRVPEDFIKDFRHAIPPLPEQRAIAAFLDRETARIDSLIAKKQKQIELLQRKRAALISQAVTKGLDPKAKMKDSGVEWLGAVPEGWKFSKLGYIVRCLGGATPNKSNESYWEGHIPWVSPKDMKKRDILDAEDHISSEALRDSPLVLLPIGAVLIVVRGMILAHTFPVAVTRSSVTINQDMKALVPTQSADSDYLAYLLEACSPALLARTEESAHGTKCLRTEMWKSFPLYLPQLGEQREIVAYVNQESARIDVLRWKIESSVDLLRKYRTALISAAVTGKIDVRQEVPVE